MNKIIDEQASKTSKRGNAQGVNEFDRGWETKKSSFSLLNAFIPQEDFIKKQWTLLKRSEIHDSLTDIGKLYLL